MEKYFLDSQTAEIDIEGYFKGSVLSETKLTRIDNLPINIGLAHHIFEAKK